MYNTLGRTGLKVTSIAFGGIPIQRSDAANTQEVIDKLIEYGMNYIDSARGYTVSEEYIGQAIEGKRDKFILATKSMSRDYESMKADIEISLKNFRTDYIDIYQLHNVKPTDFDTIFGENGAYKALSEAKEAGKIGFIGGTAHSIDTLNIMVDTYGDVLDTVMFPYNIVELQGHDTLARAKEKGIGTIAMKPLAGGNLDDYELALKFIAASNVIDLSIPGMGDAAEVVKNAEVWKSLCPLTQDETAKLEGIRKELGQTFCRRCGYCAPCSVGIDIPNNFLMANYYKRYEGLASWATTRYEALPKKASDCIKCGKCEPRCPYDLPIISMLEDVVKTFEK
ncbi:MAG: aldo/keto reductase [Eubacteriales bacterium]